jgi:phage-related protein
LKKIPPILKGMLPDLTKTTGTLIKQVADYASKSMPTFTQKVLPKAVQELQKSLPTLLTNVTTGFNSILTGAADAIITALPVVTQTVLPAMIEGTTDLVSGLIDRLPAAVTELTNGAVTLFMGIIDGLNEVADKLLPMLPELVGTATDALVENLPQFLEGALQLFGKLTEALADVTNEIMPKIPKLIEDISSQLVDEGELDKIIDSGFELLVSLVEGFANAMPTIMAELPKIVVSIADRLTKPSNLGRLMRAGVKLIKAVAEGLPRAVHYILENIPTIIDNIWNSLTEVDWFSLGEDIVKGILSAFKNAGDWIADSVGDFKDEVLDRFDFDFEIFSPSHVMRDEVGKYLGLGIVKGFTDTMAAKTEEMAKSIPREFDTDVKLNTNADLAYARSISRANGGNNTYNIPVNITFTGNIDSSTNVRKLAEELAQETQYQLAGMGLTG